MSIFNIKQSFILYQTFGNIYTIASFCKHALCVFHGIAWLIFLAHAQTNFPPVKYDANFNTSKVWKYQVSFCPNYLLTFKATPIAEPLNNLLMRRQNLFVDIFV